MATVQKVSSYKLSLTKEGQMAKLKEAARRAANKFRRQLGLTQVPAKEDELSQWAKRWFDVRRAVRRVMAEKYPDKYSMDMDA